MRWPERRFVVVDYAGMDAIVAREVGKRRLQRIPVNEAVKDLTRIAHTRFRSGSCGDFEGGDGVQEGDFRAHPGLVGVEEWAPGGLLASTMRVCEQGLALAEASSFSCVNKSSLKKASRSLEIAA